MDADRPPSESASQVPDEPAEAVPPTPAVVAVVVAREEAAHLDRCLAALAAADYPDLTVVVVGAGTEDLAARVATSLPTAFVRPLGATGWAAAANEALTTVAGAPFLLFCHDDVVCDPDAIRVLVAEAYRSNAAILGPKIVDPERPELLREVGWSVDRFGVPHSEIQADELDQEQHDAVRDVFFVSDACMLMRADLFTELGGFDEGADPGARALDLCWRARLAGARVMVVPDARVGHVGADGPEDVDERLVHRHRVRTLLVATGGLRLCWIAPIAFLMQMAEALVLLVQRNRSRAGALAGAWTWNLRHLGPLRRSRTAREQGRVVPDGELRAFQYHGSARLAAYVTTSLHAPDRVRSLSERGRSVADTANSSLRSLRGLLLLGVVALVLIGTRGFLVDRVAAVGQLAPWPGIGDLLRTFTSEWRSAGLGAQSPAPPAFAVAGILQVLTRRVRRPGAIARARARDPRRDGGRVPARGGASAPVAGGRSWPRASTGSCRSRGTRSNSAISVRWASTWRHPSSRLAVFQLGGLLPLRWPRRRVGTLAAVAVGVATAWWPPALLLPLVLLAGLLLAAPFSGDGLLVLRRCARATLAITGLALLVLVPWPFAFLASGDRLGALGIAGAPVTSFADLLRFLTASNGAGIAGWAFVLAGLLVAAIATGERAVWSARLWGLAVMSWWLAALPAWLGTVAPEVEGMLVPAALAMALLAGVGVVTFRDEVRTRGLGWQQVAAIGAGALLVLGALGFSGDTVGGRFHQPSRDWIDALDWMQAQRDGGPFRVLWLGDPAAVPGAAHRAGPDVYALTVDGPGDLRDLLPPPGGASPTATVNGAVDALRTRRTSRFGAQVAAAAIRYVVVPVQPAPDSATGRMPLRLAAAFADQLDLRELQSTPGIRVFENTAWVPGDGLLANGPGALGPDAVPHPAAPTGPGVTRLWSQQYSSAWEASTGGRALAHRSAFGWANAFPVSQRSPIDVTFARQWWRWVTLALELAIVGWYGRRVLRRKRRRVRADAEPTPDGVEAPVTS